MRGDLAASQREVTAGQQRHAAAREQMQVVQHELEGLRRERPALTPRPTRDVATLKDLINNEKVRQIKPCSSASQPVTDWLRVGVRCGRPEVTETPVVLCEGVDAGGQRLLGYLWSVLRYNGAQDDAVLAMQAFLTLLLQLTPVQGCCAVCWGHNRRPAKAVSGRLSGPQRIPGRSSEVLSLPVLMLCIEPFFFCCVSFCAECSTVNSAINTGTTQIVDTQVTLKSHS